MSQLALFDDEPAVVVPSTPRERLQADRRTAADVDGLVELLEVVRSLGKPSPFAAVMRASRLDNAKCGERLDWLLCLGLVDVKAEGESVGFVVSEIGEAK